MNATINIKVYPAAGGEPVTVELEYLPELNARMDVFGKGYGNILDEESGGIICLPWNDATT